MRNPGYTMLGWIVWQLGRRVARRKLEENRVRLGAAGAAALAVAAGIVLARARTDGAK
jgi:hypothetical protein